MYGKTASSSQAMAPLVDPKTALAAPLGKLRVRADYLAAAKAKRVSTTGFVLQARKRVEASAPSRAMESLARKRWATLLRAIGPNVGCGPSRTACFRS
jgi:hypothetical protein